METLDPGFGADLVATVYLPYFSGRRRTWLENQACQLTLGLSSFWDSRFSPCLMEVETR